MNYMWNFMSNFKEFYNDINSATLTGAIDVIVVRQEDGSYLSSPFHVRFGKLGVLRSRAKVVDIEINGEPVGIQMKLGESGEAFFVEETNDETDVPSYLATSPISNNFEEHMSLKNGRQNTEIDSADVQIVNSNYSQETVKVCEFPDITGDSTVNKSLIINETDETKIKFKESKETTKSGSTSVITENITTKTEDTEVIENTDKSTTKAKKKRRKRTFKRRSIIKTSEAVDQGGSENATIENSEDTGEEIFQMDVEDEGDSPTSFKQILIPPTPSPSQASQLSNMSRSGVIEFGEKYNEWTNVPILYKGLQIPHNNSEGINTAFSDGEATPVEGRSSPSGSRPSTPKSDSEFEMRKGQFKNTDSQDQWSWTWGELPVPPQSPPQKEHQDPFSDDDTSVKAKQIKKDQDEQRSMFGGVFKLMGMSRKGGPTVTDSNEKQGLYLDDLNSSDLDPEVASLYLTTNSKWSSQEKRQESTAVIKDDDTESGHGSSLPQSPHSVEGAIGGHRTSGIDSDGEETAITTSDLKDVNDVAFSMCGNILQLNPEPAYQQFQKSVITYEQFCSDPNIINHPDLMVRINGKYCNWSTAAPILMSFVLFQKPLPDTIVNNLLKDNSPKAKTKAQRRGYSWFSWRRQTGEENEQTVSTSVTSSKHDDSSDDSMSRTQKLPVTSPSQSVSINMQIEDVPDVAKSTENLKVAKQPSVYENYKKSLRLSSQQIAQLNLKDGPNEVVFSVTTAYQGTTRCKCHIYLWRHDDRIVISDIDGTITKSDVLGHILPIVGKSWAQSGVAQLFTNIKQNGYQFLYLSARAIGQARITRDYLRSIKQGDITLPEGPLLLSPSSLISALHREVIEKKPEEFKINCLRDIQALFRNRNPFWAGYGNKINDVWAYLAVGIPLLRIYTINHRGELKHEHNKTFQSSYSSLSGWVDHLFPPMRTCSGNGLLTTDFVGAEEFSSFTFWKEPIVDVELVDQTTAEVSSKKTK